MSVILTDVHGAPLGCIEKSKAHGGEGILHKAFSIFIFGNNSNDLLIQKRADHKLFGGLWANACCSHPTAPPHMRGLRGAGPIEIENIVMAGQRRLQEELGFTCSLLEAGSFVYRAADPRGGGSEYEHDTVLVGGVDDAEVRADPKEVSDWKWVKLLELQKDLEECPEKYAPWFREALSIALKHYGT